MKSVSLVTLMLCTSSVILAPITVPVDNHVTPSYSSAQTAYDDINVSARRPNSFFNRLPPYANKIEVDDIVANNDNDYDDQQTDKPVISNSNQQHYTNYNDFLNNYLLNENRVKKKKKRVRRPCVPIQSAGSPLYTNRLKRDINSNAEGGKTFDFFGLGYYAPGYYGPGYTSYQGELSDNVKPQYDKPSSSQNYGQNVQYQPYGGYPCIPISYGHRPGHRPGLGGGSLLDEDGIFGGGGGLLGNNGLFGSGGLGLFGQGGLLDFGVPAPLAPAGVYQGTGNYPQTVIINRPPLFANPPNFNRPIYSNNPSYNRPTYSNNPNYNRPGYQDNFGINQPGFWGTVVNKLQDFVIIAENLRV
ncbi:CLUMA_CG015070, isoform A [Clunio marinus]|uniref:CLUMA_CG015070, isoform A n=1 Tax=Clunio marinus TaxID=568069 RepID=A0A1J1IR94_9DIPT|nr:CLUMA_CG015070, isoform A [Clunio marinus]